jgi:hypothetical protein
MSSKDALAVSSSDPEPYVAGDGNVHVHVCPIGPHEWNCDSCYCNRMRTRCPAHGGAVPKLNASR